MTPTEMNRKIAELCGIEPELVGYIVKSKTDGNICLSSDSKRECEEWRMRMIASGCPQYIYYTVEPLTRYPNYTGDLNAMAKARATLTEEERRKFACLICNEVGHCATEPNFTNIFKVINAPTAKQAECFLKVKGVM